MTPNLKKLSRMQKSLMLILSETPMTFAQLVQKTGDMWIDQTVRTLEGRGWLDQVALPKPDSKKRAAKTCRAWKLNALGLEAQQAIKEAMKADA